MKKLLVQQHDCKFIQNILYANIDNVKIIGAIFYNELYRLYFVHKPTHIIFIASRINSEILQFIAEYGAAVKCYIYHDKIFSDEIWKHETLVNCYHLIENDTRLDNKNIIQIPQLLNSNIYNSESTLEKNESIVCFIQGLKEIPEQLSSVLWPNTTLPIKMFHNPNIPHPQNLGILTEANRAEVLKQHKYYLALNINDSYLPEACACGCQIVYLDDIQNYKYNKSDTAPSKTTEYSQFLSEAIL